ncbi:roadblock/LC7 domain-containing protein [candidate division KSB1 bacterium]|nr:roadblock/LC7 domain-containing protein [candidate division KSB1 bacterium]MBL7092626.1 roadblock/LC7 domain-containing protein [candidate division KSB1 bacterium]
MSEKLFLSSELSMKLDKIVNQLMEKLRPRFIILADITGQLLSSYLAKKDIDVTGLSALFASNIGATKAIAEKLDQTASFDFILHEGKDMNIFLSKIEKSFLLAVVFKKTDQIGMVRLFTKKASEELQSLIKEYEEERPNAVKQVLGGEFSSKLADQLASIIN